MSSDLECVGERRLLKFWFVGLALAAQPSQQHCRYAAGELQGEHRGTALLWSRHGGCRKCFQGAALRAFCGSSETAPYSYCSPNYWQGCMLGAKGVTCLNTFKISI